MSSSTDVSVRKINELHPGWDIEIEPPPAGPRTGSIRQPGGSGLIRYAWNADDQGPYLEFYSFHRIWGDDHRRIYESGEVMGLDVLETTVPLTGDPDEDKKLTEAQNEGNRKLLAELEEAGLLSDGPVPMSFTVNAALATGLVDPDKDAPS
ncbi:MAG: hypothetical protein ABR505_00870 [Actinomycetota bacterium]